jgi:hypothetical protein
MKTLILNSSNVVEDGTNSKFIYSFPNGGYEFKDDYIAVAELSMYFSAFNITTGYNNKSFSYIWVDGTSHTINIPDSFLQVADINAFMHSVMFANKHYLTTSTGNIIYLIEMVINQPLYAVQVNNYVISATLATTNTWTLPAGATWVLPTNLILPYLVIPATNNFGKLIGFEPGQYPAGVIAGTPPAQTQTPAFTSAQSTLSTIAPQITPYSSFLVYCSLVNNKATIPNQLVFSFTPKDATFGALQSYSPNAELGWNKIENGVYNSFLVEFRDQLGRPVFFKDPNTLITLLTKNKYEMS